MKEIFKIATLRTGYTSASLYLTHYTVRAHSLFSHQLYWWFSSIRVWNFSIDAFNSGFNFCVLFPIHLNYVPIYKCLCSSKLCTDYAITLIQCLPCYLVSVGVECTWKVHVNSWNLNTRIIFAYCMFVFVSVFIPQNPEYGFCTPASFNCSYPIYLIMAWQEDATLQFLISMQLCFLVAQCFTELHPGSANCPPPTQTTRHRKRRPSPVTPGR